MYRPCLHCESKKYDEDYCPEICTYGEARKRLKELEDAAAVSAPHGRWKRVGQVCVDGEYVDIYRCSKCSIPHDKKTRYCPNCGAKMDR